MMSINLLKLKFSHIDYQMVKKRKKKNEKVEREETWDITNNCKSLERLEKGASIKERRSINRIDLQTQTKNK
jgi:hypothetical protein